MDDLESRATRRARVYSLMSDGAWHTTMEINAVDVGGSEGCRRLREIRRSAENGRYDEWSGVEKRKVGGGSSQWEYRMILRSTDPNAKPGKKEQLPLFKSGRRTRKD